MFLCVSRSAVTSWFWTPHEQVERLLKLGAYDVFREGDEGDKASKAFCEEVRQVFGTSHRVRAILFMMTASWSTPTDCCTGH